MIHTLCRVLQSSFNISNIEIHFYFVSEPIHSQLGTKIKGNALFSSTFMTSLLLISKIVSTLEIVIYWYFIVKTNKTNASLNVSVKNPRIAHQLIHHFSTPFVT